MATQASHKPQFYVVELGLEDADDAYPLIRSIAPEVAPDGWRKYVRRRCRDGGFKGLFDDSGMLIGLFSYRLGERLRAGRVLALDDFVTFELSQAAPGRQLLMALAQKLARHKGCTGIEVRIGARGIADPASAKANGWLALGMALESAVFTKTL
ncbi:MAG TPA: hypothetical protein VFO12_05415 [Sphingomicrobium sp.]|nr:hypothetical protein [Sphingomicrobium sp.]